MAKDVSKTKEPLFQSGFLSVRSVREGFRRGGRAWSVQAEIVSAADFTALQLEQIQGEPLLVVAQVSPAEAKAAAAAEAE